MYERELSPELVIPRMGFENLDVKDATPLNVLNESSNSVNSAYNGIRANFWVDKDEGLDK
jgi:hypothetical protein